MSFNAKVFLLRFLNLKIKNLTQTPVSPLLHLPCTGRPDLAVHLSSFLGKEFEMVIRWILSFSFSSLTLRLFLCVPSRAPAVRAGLQCLPWCLVLQQLPPYFLLLICFVFLQESTNDPQAQRYVLVVQPCANQTHTVLTLSTKSSKQQPCREMQIYLQATLNVPPSSLSLQNKHPQYLLRKTVKDTLFQRALHPDC